MVKEFRTKGDTTTRVQAKEEEKEVRFWVNVLTAVEKDIQRETVLTQERGSKGLASRVEGKDNVQLSALLGKDLEEEKTDT